MRAGRRRRSAATTRLQDRARDPREVSRTTSAPARSSPATSSSKGNADEAIKIFEELLAVDPNNAEAYNQIGYYYGYRGDYEKAIENLKRYQFIAAGQREPVRLPRRDPGLLGPLQRGDREPEPRAGDQARLRRSRRPPRRGLRGHGRLREGDRELREGRGDRPTPTDMRRDYLDARDARGLSRGRPDGGPSARRAKSKARQAEGRVRRASTRPFIDAVLRRWSRGGRPRPSERLAELKPAARGALSREREGRPPGYKPHFPQWNCLMALRARGAGQGPTRRSAYWQKNANPPNPFENFEERRWIYEARAQVAAILARQGELDEAEKLIAENRKWNPNWAPTRPAERRWRSCGARRCSPPRSSGRAMETVPPLRDPAQASPPRDALRRRASRSAPCRTRRRSSRTSWPRVVGVLDASRGYLATFARRRRAARRGAGRLSQAPRRRPSSRRTSSSATCCTSESAVTREKFKLLRHARARPPSAPRIRAAADRSASSCSPTRRCAGAARRPSTRRTRRFLVSLAGLCGMAIENRRHLERLTRERERLEEENRRLLDETGRSAAGRLFVGDSPAARRVLDLVARVATSKISVLLTGESGTGKELVARMIHARSDRADKPFVAINCAALPETLLESELFGIERGVATGVEARAGKFETAQGGTLFLDEIGDMPLAAPGQAPARPPGARDRARRRPAPRPDRRAGPRGDARAACPSGSRGASSARTSTTGCASSRSRCRRCASGGRTSPGSSATSSSASRRARAGTRPTLDRDAFAALLAHDFPGNIRELENLLEGAAALSQGGTIRREDLQWLPSRACGWPRRRRGLGRGGDPGPAGPGGAPHPARPAAGRRKQEPGGAAARDQPPDALPEAPGGTLGSL